MPDSVRSSRPDAARAPAPGSARTVALSAAVAAIIAAGYLIASPSSQDLAAATFRADLFSEHGWLLWNNNWYSGHHLLSYSVIYPPLASLLGVRLVGALAVVIAAGMFAALATRRFGRRALWPSLWFAAAIAVWLLTGRMPFLLAVPFALGALLADRRASGILAALLAATATLASPVAGLFVGLAGVSLALAGERLRGLALALGAGVPMVVLNFAFPVGGEEPFVFSAFFAIPLLALIVLWLVPAEQRALRVGAVLYALLAVAVFVIPNPLGGNVTRLGALLAGPLLALVLWPRGRLVVLAVSLPLLYWQMIAPVRDLSKASGDPSTERSFHEPLLAELDRLADGGRTFRVQIPPTKNRWEAAYVAPEYPLARGWLRQLEHDDFDLFTDGELTPEAYRAWLERHAVSFVAVADAPLDYLAEDEVDLIGAGLDYLEPVWENEDWRLFRVDGSRSFGLAAVGVTEIAPGRLTVSGGRATVEVPVNWTHLWSVDGGAGCLEESEDGRLAVEAEGRAPIGVETRLGGERCAG